MSSVLIKYHKYILDILEKTYTELDNQEGLEFIKKELEWIHVYWMKINLENRVLKRMSMIPQRNLKLKWLRQR